MSIESCHDEQIQFDPESKSPNNEQEIEYELQKSNEQSQLQDIIQEQMDKQMLESKEKERQIRLKNLPIKIKRQLSTINEVSDQNISPQIDLQGGIFQTKRQEQGLFKIIEEQKEGQSNLSKKPHKKRKRTKELSKIDLGYSSGLNIRKYYKDKRIDFGWKLLFSYYTLLILSNIILNLIELIHYSQSVCKLTGIDNIFIYLNQIIYICCKMGILSLNYQEFTNTLPTKQKIPLLHSVLFSSIFPVLSMPLYVYDFVECTPRSNLFTLQESLYILNFIDWCFISVFSLFITTNSCLRISLSKYRWQFIKKILTIIYYLFLILIHLLQILMLITQSMQSLLPAMILENLYFCFSTLVMLYLCIYKYCTKQDPFEFPELNEQVILSN